MQMLVYENYSKFIRATDTIKQMKFTVEGLWDDLTALEGSIDRIGSHQERIEGRLSERSGEIQKLLGTQTLLRKVRLLFELPKTLRLCLDRELYGKAVQAYCRCSGFLRQYKHMETFRKILEEVELIMNQIRTALEKRLKGVDLG